MVGNYDVMGLQDAALANMTRPAAGTVDEPGRAVAAKSGLNRSLLEQNPGDLRSQLFRRAEWKLDRRDVQAGGQVVPVDPGNTTRTCCRCGSLNDGPGTDRAHRCGSCRLELDQDANAAVNTRRATQDAAGMERDRNLGPFEYGAAVETSEPGRSRGRAGSPAVRLRAPHVRQTGLLPAPGDGRQARIGSADCLQMDSSRAATHHRQRVERK